MREIPNEWLGVIEEKVNERIKDKFTTSQIEIIISNLIEGRLRAALTDKANEVFNNEIKKLSACVIKKILIEDRLESHIECIIRKYIYKRDFEMYVCFLLEHEDFPLQAKVLEVFRKLIP